MYLNEHLIFRKLITKISYRWDGKSKEQTNETLFYERSHIKYDKNSYFCLCIFR